MSYRFWKILQEGFAMALASSASPVAAQLQQSLRQSASRAGAAHASHGVSWASSFGSVRVFHSAQMRPGDLDEPIFGFLATLYLPYCHIFARPLPVLFLVNATISNDFVRQCRRIAAQEEYSWFTCSWPHRNSGGPRNHRPCGLPCCETRGRFISF